MSSRTRRVGSRAHGKPTNIKPIRLIVVVDIRMKAFTTYRTYKMKVIALSCLFCFSFHSSAQLFLQAESGAVFTGLNDIRNGSTGTLLSLKTDLSTPVGPFLRLRLGYVLKEKHHFSILYAPFKVMARGTLDQDIRFDGQTFAANLPLEAVYKFNSYRFTYNRRLVHTDKLKLGVGVSAKIRDAGSSLKNENVSRADFGIGFVPLINVIADWRLANKWSLLFFGDGLVASRGRAVDLSLTVNYAIHQNWRLAMGYRLLDGGTDGSSSYNFVRLHFATTSLTYTL